MRSRVAARPGCLPQIYAALFGAALIYAIRPPEDTGTSTRPLRAG